jgi:hypothetical protein
VLLNDGDLAIRFDGALLDPSQEILSDTSVDIAFGDGGMHKGRVRIIEWRSGRHQAVYFGTDEQHFAYEESGKDIEGQYPYSAHATWDGLTTERAALLGLGDIAPEPVSSLWEAVRDAIRAHFATRRTEHRREQVQGWKDAGVYPYQGEPSANMIVNRQKFLTALEHILFDPDDSPAVKERGQLSSSPAPMTRSCATASGPRAMRSK